MPRQSHSQLAPKLSLFTQWVVIHNAGRHSLRLHISKSYQFNLRKRFRYVTFEKRS